MAKLPDAQLSHIGLRVGNLPLMIAFYERALGLVLTDKGIVATRARLLKAARLNRDGKSVPALDEKSQHVRSCAIELPHAVHFKDGAMDGLFRDLGTDPVTV